MNFLPDSRQLHRLLAYRPGRAGVRIEIEERPEGIFATVDDEPAWQLTDAARPPSYRIDNAVKAFAAMMSHYPAPVIINGEPLATADSPPEPGLRVDYTYGNIQRPAAGSKPIQGERGPVILMNGVRYRLGGHSSGNAGPDAFQPVMALGYLAADRQDEHPNYARTVKYTAWPAYRWDPTDESELELTKFASQAEMGDPNSCYPPAAALRALELSQLASQEWASRDAVMDRIRSGAAESANVTDVEAARYLLNPYGRFGSSFQAVNDHYNYGAELIPYNCVATVDRKRIHDPAVTYALARGLYGAPGLDLVPVAVGYGVEPPELDITCAGVTVTMANGATLFLEAHRGGNIDDFTPTQNPEPQEVAGCRSIVAHIHVNGDQDEDLSLPLTMFCSRRPRNGKHLADGPVGAGGRRRTRRDAVRDVLAGGRPPDWMRDDEYADRLHALAVTLLVNREEGVAQEVRELCNNFTPRSLPKDSPAAVFAACPPRHSLIWQPAPQEDLPSWLTAAVAGLNPGRPGEAVRRQSRTIHEDPALMAWLRALLTVPA